VIAGNPGQATPVFGSPDQIYRGLREKRNILREQKDVLERERNEIAQQVRSGPVGDADRTGLEQRLAQADQAITKVSIDIAETDAQLAQAASVPGAIVEEPPRNDWVNGPPVELIAWGMGLTAVLLLPLVIARARRLWRSANVVSAVPPEMVERITRMERGIDAIAVEVERIGEGQRFVTQLLAERADAEPVRLASGGPSGGPSVSH
jgi:hypothetical protein